MNWRGKELKTIGDLGDAVSKLQTPEEGAEFMALYSAANPHAKENIGYIAGYYDRDTKHRIHELTGTQHPIFGRGDPTPETALRAGMLAGARAKRTAEDNNGKT